jgi:hypothetical protein
MLLTVEELREFITTGLSDDALQLLLDATEADITAAAGDPVEQTYHVQGGYPALVLPRPAPSPDYDLTSVTEDADTDNELVLDEDDYRIDGYILHRLHTSSDISSEKIGEYSVSYGRGPTYEERYKAILESLRPLMVA